MSEPKPVFCIWDDEMGCYLPAVHPFFFDTEREAKEQVVLLGWKETMIVKLVPKTVT